MVTIVSPEQLFPSGARSGLFQGGDYGDVPISFFWVESPPGSGPRLHRHPYVELFVVQDGTATFTVGDQTHEVTERHIVVAPAGVPHTFRNSGDGPLRMINIHPNREVVTEWLEPEGEKA